MFDDDTTVVKNVAALLRRIVVLLRRTAPVSAGSDTVWAGPYFISRRREWHPTTFVLYEDHLYSSVTIGWHIYNMTWKVGGNEIEFEQGFGSCGDYNNNEYLWARVLHQVCRKLARAVGNPARYNQHVERCLPLACRTGKVERHFTWEKGMKSVLPMTTIERLEELLIGANAVPGLKEMTLDMYLAAVAAAYDAVFEDLRPLSPLEKYKRRADGRHGGLLDLSPGDPKEFEQWYHSGRWSGCHPWEIVFGHPHGIMLAPHDEDGRWHFILRVDSLGWYRTAALMAIAVAEKGVPFEFRKGREVIDAMRGVDMVEVGPFWGMVSFDELREERPDALEHIRWDPIRRIDKAVRQG